MRFTALLLVLGLPTLITAHPKPVPEADMDDNDEQGNCPDGRVELCCAGERMSWWPGITEYLVPDSDRPVVFHPWSCQPAGDRCRNDVPPFCCKQPILYLWQQCRQQIGSKYEDAE